MRNILPPLKAVAICVSAMVLVSGAASAETLSFDVLRNGQPFGTHTVKIDRNGDFVRVRSNVQMEAKVGPLVVFRYRSQCDENWKADSLQKLSCATLKNGKTHLVNAVREGSELSVSVDGKAAKTAPDIVPVSPWNMWAIGETQTLSVEDGKILPLKVTDLGRVNLTINGKSFEARRVRFKSNLTLDSWYDSSGRWLKAQFTARGQNIEYRPRIIS